jgi:pimeloyl-ACP methyl ester carboxylesterase
LRAASVPEPYVLVGHSLGGLLVQLYGQTHPEQVAGIVFVDAWSPTLPELLGDRGNPISLYTPPSWSSAAPRAPEFKPVCPTSLPHYGVAAGQRWQAVLQ